MKLAIEKVKNEETEREREREGTLDLNAAKEKLAWKLDSSKLSAVAEGEAPPLHERGVVGLPRVESASLIGRTASHLNETDLERGCLSPHRSGTTALGKDLREDDAA